MKNMPKRYLYDFSESGIKTEIDAFAAWEYFVGNQTPAEFMRESTAPDAAHAPPYAAGEVDAAVQKYVEELLTSNPGCVAEGNAALVVHALKQVIHATLD
jgi:hypothetical protein